MPDYFTLEEFRELPDMADDDVYSDEVIEAAAAYIVGVIEREVGTSFIAREVEDEKHDGGGYSIPLNSARVLEVTAVTVNGVAVASDQLNLDGSILERFTVGATSPSVWTTGRRNVMVTYDAGYSAEPPADVKSAAMYGTRSRLLEKAAASGMDERRTSLNTDMGVINYTVAGQDNPTGYPQVDAVIMGWKRALAPLAV